MALLRHEIWRGPEGLTGVCLAGPMGDDFRALQDPGAELVGIIDASSHVEVMTKYYEMMGWGSYTTDFECDYQPYPEEWLAIQQGRISNGAAK
jgi:hypothetical protein